jgi:hypothetical protein
MNLKTFERKSGLVAPSRVGERKPLSPAAAIAFWTVLSVAGWVGITLLVIALFG